MSTAERRRVGNGISARASNQEDPAMDAIQEVRGIANRALGNTSNIIDQLLTLQLFVEDEFVKLRTLLAGEPVVSAVQIPFEPDPEPEPEVDIRTLKSASQEELLDGPFDYIKEHRELKDQLTQALQSEYVPWKSLAMLSKALGVSVPKERVPKESDVGKLVWNGKAGKWYPRNAMGVVRRYNKWLADLLEAMNGQD